MAWRRPTDKPLSEHDGWFTDVYMHYSASMSLGSTTSNDANLCWVGSSNDNLKIWATSREEKMPSQPSDINVSWTNMTPEDTITWRHKKQNKKKNQTWRHFLHYEPFVREGIGNRFSGILLQAYLYYNPLQFYNTLWFADTVTIQMH